MTYSIAGALDLCNLYTIATKNIKKHIIKLYVDVLKLLQTRDSRKNESYDAKVLALLACIVRCFLDLEFLNVMLCFGALLGAHLVGPFLILTASTAMTYSTLIPAFQQLYHDLLSS